ncbi:ABC transporter ATP-binding protein [Actinomyces slackii]|uniref:Multidrug resistance ABC transporter ATP-binding/permease protein BmrA n=1 Tax=Actinomyces slackii TaxID=52774 RepID=A0A3S4WKB4_9ACTO|nr:ABC transporter ATP-binding protein [Actinomyces slackii]VEG74756.1 Multidrug resistance ABC transporter ATP-binding/permease protein BmrA [Actinomyces slackii]
MTSIGPAAPAPPSDQPPLPMREGLRVLYPYARPHLPAIGAGIVLGLLATATSLATPLATKRVLDILGGEGSLIVPVLILVALLIAGTLAGGAQAFVLGRVAEHVVLSARTTLIERFFRARLMAVQRFRTGELITRVTSDTVLLRSAVTSSVVDLVNGMVALVGTIVLMGVLDWPMLLIALVAVAGVTAMIGILLPRISHAEERAQDALGDLGATLEGSLRALRTIKASRAEGREIARISGQAEHSTKHSVRAVVYEALVWSIADGGMQLAMIAILGVGAWRVSTGDMATSTLVAFLLYAFNLVNPITVLSTVLADLQSGLAAAARIRQTESLTAEEDAEPASRQAPPSAHAPVLSLRGVSAAYDGTPALEAVSLDIPRTGHTALVGPSGAGKTTVFSLLLRFLDPTEGTIALDGTPYSELSIDQVRSRIAYVEQETPIIPGTVRDNVLLRSPTSDDAAAWRALAAARLDERIRSMPLGLDTVVADTRLSGGERQRLAVARALVGSPEILLLDEATAQLDAGTEAAIAEVIAQASRSGAVITIAHRLSTVLDADQIIVMDGGRLRDRGTHAELMARDSLYRESVQALRIHSAPPEAGTQTVSPH